SMRSPTKFGGKTRKDAAVDALDTVLKDVPEGTVVGVLVFSQEQDLANPGQKNRDARIQELRAPQRWKRDQREQLVSRARDLTPYHYTPLARAMWKGKQVFGDAQKTFPDEFAAGKTLLVLTDGDDDLFQDDKQLHAIHGTKEIPEFLKAEFDEE